VSDLLSGYDNRTGRPPGRFVSALGLVLTGIAAVRRTADPLADTWHERNREALQSPGAGRRWIVLGDSMMQGVGASSIDAGLVGQLHDRLLAQGFPLSVINLSATGARVPDVLDQQVPVMQSLPPAEGAPDLVTVLAGSNDLFGGRAHRRGLPDAMARLVQVLPRGAVVCTLPQPRAAARAANVHLDEAARRGQLRLVDLRVSGPRSWRGKLAADRFHPNDAGYAGMADAFEPVLLETLREDPVDATG
jgi:lysophospholipase L1-like esterase